MKSKTRHLNMEIRLSQVLMTIADNEPVRASDVARYLELHPKTVRHYARHLQALGRIRRTLGYYWETTK